MELDRFEINLLKTLSKIKKGKLNAIVKTSNINIDQGRRASESLKSKGYIQIQSISQEFIALDSQGVNFASKGLPERIIINALSSLGGKSEFNELKKNTALDVQDFSSGFGKAIKNMWLKIEKKDQHQTTVEILKNIKKSKEEVFLEFLWQSKNMDKSLLNKDHSIINELSKRPNIIKNTIVKTEVLKITSLGSDKIKNLDINQEIALTQITSQIIKTGIWKNLKFKRYDLNAPTSPVHIGKRHPLREILEEIREIFVSMGFIEIDGNIIESSFWNFDVLFQPQDHPARDMQDTFYLDLPKSEINLDKKLVKNIKQTHMNGWKTGSTGWGGNWNISEASKPVLRTHTTVRTIKNLYEKGDIPQKSFLIGNVFRNEKVTYKNTSEFHQIDGVVIDQSTTLRQLMGIVKHFYSKLGLNEVKFWPSYFPYTEPSIQGSAYVKKLGRWVELCGMGVFRPEVTLPLGIKSPVLAWGGGVERIAMLRYDLNDIRDFYKNDLGFLRRSPKRPQLK